MTDDSAPIRIERGITMLSVEMYDVDPTSKTYAEFTGGFPYIVSGLKTLVETGASMAL